MTRDLEQFVGRSAVFIENGDACLGIVDSVRTIDDQIDARFQWIPDSFRCRMRRTIESPSEDLIEFTLDEPPFGESWSVSVSDREFYTDADHWQASFLFGSGFRVFFDDDYVARFRDGDVLWLNEDYHGDNAE